MRIEKFLVLSTSHVSEQTAEKLNTDLNHFPCWGGQIDYEWWVCVEELGNDQVVLPDDLKACMHFAGQQGCTWIRFDCDEPAITELPQYDW